MNRLPMISSIVMRFDNTCLNLLTINDFKRETKLLVWDKMTKKKMNTLISANATAEIRIGENLVKIKEERELLQRIKVILKKTEKQ